ncbi:ATP-binding protein [Spirosoma sp. RP8]|uniref:histidine kinase n=1 Tax=Spirosoma liriopis TaxID=2937440 RepID=A0ABT0HSR2_9BACT|nr:ATP-binding protein [Spirosoma liriopis]MCK8495204.1 ATP-binding protein [Spirosoma liriopis]
MATTDPQQNASLDPFASAYAAAFANMDQGFCFLEKVDTPANKPPDFRYQMVNPAFEKHTGLTNVIGKTSRQVVPQLDERIITLYEQVARTGQSTQFQTYVAPLDRWIEANVFPISQQPAQIAVLFTNITDRKRAEEAQQVSEVTYRTLFETMEQGFGIGQILPADQQAGRPMDYQWLEVNPRFEQLTGLARADVLSQTTRQLIPGLEETWYEGYGHVAATGETVSFEAYSPVLSRWFEVYVFALGSPASRRVGVLFSNTTERKQQQKRQALLLKLADAIRPLTASGDIMTTVSELIGRHYEVDRCGFAELPPPYNQLVISRDWTKAGMPSRQDAYPLSSWSGELIRRLRSGQTVVDDAGKDSQNPPPEAPSKRAGDRGSRIWAPRLKEGQWVGSFFVEDAPSRFWNEADVGLLEEIAERTWAAVERARAEEALGEEYRRKDEFMAMLAHELRNPLASLANTLLVLQLTRGTDENLSYPQAVGQMSQQVGHMSRMVDDLLDVGRIRYGLIQLHRKPLDLVTLMRQTVETVKPFYSQQRRQLSVSLPPYALPMLGDETRLVQVVMNLLTNGLRYTNPGGHVWVSLQLEKDEAQPKQALLRVKDDGIGIALDRQATIFDIFVQGETTLDRPRGGLGLGLAVVKQLVVLHEGSIEVHSPGVGEGSEFLVRLPLKPESAALELPHLPVFNTATGKGRVLVIEDNQTLADMTARLVALSGYEARVSYSGMDGLVVAEQWRPDVILLDLGLPHLDGFEVNRRLREQSWGQSLPIVALTGYSPQSFQARTEQAGFAAYLIKPLNLPQLRKLLSEVVPDQ